MHTIVELLRQSVSRWGDLPAVSLYEDRSSGLTYAGLWDAARRVASYLESSGVSKGDRVVLWGANRPEWVAAFFGVHLLGGVVVPLDVRSREDLLERIVEQTSPKQLIVGDEQRRSLSRDYAGVTSLDDLFSLSRGFQPIEADTPVVQPSDIAELVFTSGTTGNPKGVILTHRNIVSNVAMASTAVEPSPKYRVLSILPLSHMYEQTGGLLTPMSGGASITYLSSLRPDVILKAMAEVRATNMCCVPQVLELFRHGIEREVRRQNREQQFRRLHNLAQRLPFGARKFLFRPIHQRMGGSFMFFLSGGAYLDPELGRWWEGVGIKVLQGYGMTEASPIVATASLTDRDVASVGRPLPGVELRFAEDHEILIRGDNITPGYWNNPTATEFAFIDGWYQSGDLGYLDEAGRLHLHGRKKNVIVLANGMNVYPEDIEHVFVSEPGVKNAVVLGLEHGQEVEIHAVLLLDSAADAPSTILKRCNERLGAQQRVRGFTVWPDENFPLTPTLKVKRGDIEARLEELNETKTSAAAETTASH